MIAIPLSKLHPAPERVAWRVDELAKATGLSRRTIARRIKDGTLVSTKRLGGRMILAESVRALFGDV